MINEFSKKESPILGLAGMGGGVPSRLLTLASGETIYVDDVFSIDLWKGTQSARSITNGIDISDEGGMIWTKSRTTGFNHYLSGPDIGTNKVIRPDADGALDTSYPSSFTAFNNNGFSLGTDAIVNLSGDDFVGWTFRKCPGFHDIVTYTGDGAASQTINHNLGCKPGLILIKRTDSSGDWAAYAKSGDNNQEIGGGSLNSSSSIQGGIAFSSNESRIIVFSGSGNFHGIDLNINGASYIAYFFAQGGADNDAKKFGASKDEDIIKVGKYTGNFSTNGPFIDLGWEPQFLIIKRITNGGGWYMLDNVRGMPFDQGDQSIRADQSNTETTQTSNMNVRLSPKGFKIVTTGAHANANNETYLYMAIRYVHKQPTTGTEVFQAFARTGSGSDNSGTNRVTNVGFCPDWVLTRATSDYTHHFYGDKQRGKNKRQLWNLGQNESSGHIYEYLSNGVSYYQNNVGANNVPYIDYYFKRAPKFFEQVCYFGTSSSLTIDHKLGVTPRLTLVKSAHGDPGVAYYVDSPTGSGLLNINSDAAAGSANGNNGYTIPLNGTSTTQLFTDTSSSWERSGLNGQRYHAYLFGDCHNISKVHHYTGNGGTNNISCGFNARFILIKRLDSTGNWMIFDTTQGITNGSDSFWTLNSLGGGTGDHVRPFSGGFSLNGSYTHTNANGGTYMYLAIA